MHVQTTIRQGYDTLSKTNKRIADCILADVDHFLRMTALEAGECYKTSSASIIRFAKTLGYSGLEEFKIALAKDSSRQEKSMAINTIINREDNMSVLCDKVEMLYDSANHDLFAMLDKVALAKAIDRLCDSENIYLLGIGASMLPAYDMYHKLKRVHIRAHYEFDSHMGVEFMHYISERDTVIAFSYSGLSKEIIYPCEIAKQKHATVIAVTRNAPSRLSELADVKLAIPNSEHLTRIGAISSRLSALEIVDLLYLGMAQRDETMFKDRLVNTSLLTRELKK